MSTAQALRAVKVTFECMRALNLARRRVLISRSTHCAYAPDDQQLMLKAHSLGSHLVWIVVVGGGVVLCLGEGPRQALEVGQIQPIAQVDAPCAAPTVA